ncbi:unnamed protein product, partial [Heterotrigona itama]
FSMEKRAKRIPEITGFTGKIHVNKAWHKWLEANRNEYSRGT